MMRSSHSVRRVLSVAVSTGLLAVRRAGQQRPQLVHVVEIGTSVVMAAMTASQAMVDRTRSRRSVQRLVECTLSLECSEYTGVMPESGLRELKKARTRRLIVDAAARLFAESGYEQVAVTDVAREAEVAEQTVYNYFPTKEQLVIDREEHVRDRLCDLIRSRSSSITSATAVREFVLESVEHIRSIPRKQWRGELGYLAAISPTVHRLALDMLERLGAAVADAILDSSEVTPEIARLEGMALAAVFQTMISEAGQRTRKGNSQAKIAADLYPIIGKMIDELDRWFRVSESSTPPRATRPSSSSLK
jgi:AcrR family transcriptional regulator